MDLHSSSQGQLVVGTGDADDERRRTEWRLQQEDIRKFGQSGSSTDITFISHLLGLGASNVKMKLGQDLKK